MKSALSIAFTLAAIGLVLPMQIHGEGLAVTVEPLEKATAVGEPVVLRCEFVNEAETQAALDLGWNDAEKISFVLDPGGEKSVALTAIQRGGGGDFGTRAVVIAPHHRIHRYVVLNQWFRPSKTGVYPLEIVVNAGAHEITGQFKIAVLAADAAAVEPRAEGLIRKYLEWRADPDDPKSLEKFNYRHTLLIAFTYVYEAFPQIGAEALKRHGDDFFVREALKEASWSGPGGSRALD